MAESEVPIVSRLRLDRESWASDLQGAKSQMTEFVQGLSAQRLTIPLAVDLTEVTARIQAFRVEQESRPIRIPVEMVPAGGGSPGGGGGGWGGRMATLMPGSGDDAVYNGPGMGSRTYNRVYNTYNAMAVAAAQAEQLNPNRYVPNLVAIEQAAEEERQIGLAMAGGATLSSEDVAAPRGRGGMRGLRTFMAAHLAFRGIEAAYGSAEQRWGNYDNQTNDPDKNAEAAVRQIRQMRSGFGGLTGVGRDILGFAFSDSPIASFLRGGNDPRGITALTGYTREDFDDQASIRQIEKASEQDRQGREQTGIQLRASDMATTLERRVGDTRETLSIATQPEGIQKRLAEIHKMTREMAEGFDKEAHLLEEAADKLKGTSPARQKLLDRAAAARSAGATIAGEVDTLESGTARHEDFLERQGRRGTLDTHLAGMSLTNDAMEAELRGDSLGASRTRIEARRRESVQEATNAYHISRGKITESDYGREVQEIDRGARLDTDLAERNASVRDLRLKNAVTESGDVSSYARARDRITGRAAEQALADPGHAAQYQTIAGNEMTNLGREHGQAMQLMRAGAQATNLRAQGRTHEADNLELASQEEAELSSNADDPEAQDAIRQKFQAQRNMRNMPHFSQTSMKSIVEDAQRAALMSGYTGQANAAIRANPGMGHPNDPNRPGGSQFPPGAMGNRSWTGGDPTGGKFSQAVDKFYDITQNVQQLAVMSGTA